MDILTKEKHTNSTFKPHQIFLGIYISNQKQDLNSIFCNFKSTNET